VIVYILLVGAAKGNLPLSFVESCNYLR